MSPSPSNPDAVIDQFLIEQEALIQAPREVVFRTLIERVHEWFFDACGEGRMVIEPRVGGRWFVDQGEGAGAWWGTVVDYQPNEKIAFYGLIGVRKPCTSVVTIELSDAEAKAGATRLFLRHRAVGVMDPGFKDSFAGGWTELIEQGLTPLCEG